MCRRAAGQEWESYVHGARGELGISKGVSVGTNEQASAVSTDGKRELTSDMSVL